MYVFQIKITNNSINKYRNVKSGQKLTAVMKTYLDQASGGTSIRTNYNNDNNDDNSNNINNNNE